MNPLVLLVEEQSTLRHRYAQFLRGEGYEVVTAQTAEEALPLARKFSPQAVVLDPDARGGRGMEVALRFLEGSQPASLIFNTSHPLSMETDFSTWVADAYTVRSHGVDELGRTLRSLLTTDPAAAASS